MQTHFDTIIVGAGLSGIGAAYYHQKKRPKKSYAILEGRNALGGTWDLFKYPGIRSDSDMYTLGFSFNPWSDPRAVADGPAILQYIKETAEKFDINKNIQYNSKAITANWSDNTKQYTLQIENPQTGNTRQITCNFLIMCSGYYNYAQGHDPQFKGKQDFNGTVIHPQHWDNSLDYAGKRIIIIGSGATAVTLLPEFQKQAQSVTMLQRSPSYIVEIPSEDKIAKFLGKFLPKKLTHWIIRWKNILVAMLFYQFGQRSPKTAKRSIQKEIKKHLGEKYKKADFDPGYKPWDQRICFIPDSDFLLALKQPNAHIITDTIDQFTANGILLNSGKELDADIIVTATGLQLQFFGGMQMMVNGKPVVSSALYTYKGVLLSDIPNLAFVAGYTNATWTLKCELSCQYILRLLTYMDKKGHSVCTPRVDPATIKDKPLLDLTSGYIKRSEHELPKQGDRKPWKLNQNYILDSIALKMKGVNSKELQFQ